MTERRVVLYERTLPRDFWIVDAAITADGGVSISSGDGTAEWYAVVDPAAKPALGRSKSICVSKPIRRGQTTMFSIS